MAKQAGLGDALYVGGYDLSGDTGSLSTIKCSRGVLDVTGIDKSAHERLLGISDGEISFAPFFNDATSQEHAILKTLPTADTQVMYFRGTTLGNPVAAMTAKQVNYDWTRGADGSLIGSVQALANSQDGHALLWCRSLTAGKKTDTSAANGTGVDDSAASSFGLSAFLQVFAFTGTSVTVTIQESSDNGSGDAFAGVTGGAFPAQSAVGFDYIETGLTLAVERYLRAVTTGTFSNAVFAVAYHRYPIARA